MASKEVKEARKNLKALKRNVKNLKRTKLQMRAINREAVKLAAQYEKWATLSVN